MKNDNIQLLQQAEQLIDNAQKSHIVGGYSIAKNTTNLELLQGPLANVICQRLAVLQYLSHEEVENIPDISTAPKEPKTLQFIERFDAAVKLMQKEAGLKVDSWLSSKTFSALQNVFSFEDPKDLKRWTQPQYQAFFNRALYARLNVLGIIPQPATRFFTLPMERANQYAELANAVTKGLNDFTTIVNHLNLRIPQTKENGNLALIAMIFDTDGLTQQLVENKIHIEGKLKQVYRPDAWNKPKRGFPKLDEKRKNAVSLRFLMAQARIETWLNGYGCEIGKKSNPIQFRPTDKISSSTYGRVFSPILNRRNNRASIRFGAELRRMLHFWSDAQALINGKPVEKVPTIKNRIKKDMEDKGSAWTYAKLALQTLDYANQLNQIELRQQDMDPSLLTQQVSKLSKTQLKSEAWSTKQNSSFIFDGIKRAWRWVVGKIKSVAHIFSEGLGLIIRAVKSVAFNSLLFYKKLNVVVSDAVAQVIKKDWWQSKNLLILRDADFDLITAFSKNASQQETLQATNKIALQTLHFKATISLIKLVMLAIDSIKNFFVNPIYGSVKALITLINFDNLFTPEDKEYIEIAFSQLSK
ncbi:hypothetical protein [Alteromonas sp. a30]|uniref:hypothetical protein n=1 Tax=Alteromonas sp. a30 TaxID=2730917 RepID=UPI00227DCBD3|nr:hypothetical protein [Alteromonas sp. a30]MCY7295042.1 hypothetical protein [Alteromonas sp. a30]